MLVNFVNNTTNSDPQQVQITQVTPVSSTGVIVPLVIDLDRSQAVELLQARGFIIGRITTEVRDDVPSDRVLSQNPPQGTELEPGDTIDIIVSVGPESISLPIVIGLTQEEALNKLNNDGFINIEIKKLKTNEYDIGVVAEQEPEANSRLEPSGVITLQVADGRISDNIPNLAGQTLAFAEDELLGKGWVTSIEEIESETIEAGRVVGTTPPSGTDHDLDESVIIQVSTGPAAIEIPSIIGQSPAAAAATLAGRGFMVAPTEDCPVDPEDPNIGLVVSQTPEAGESVETGTTITICVGVAIEPTPEPEPTPTPTEPEPTPTPTEPESTPEE